MHHDTSTRATTLVFAIGLLLLAGPATAISLGALADGASLTSEDGAVTFSDFSVSFMPGLGEGDNALAYLDLTLVDVQVLSEGDRRILAIGGGIEVSNSDLGQMWIDYSVESGNGFEIVGADLSLKAEALSLLSGVTIGESIGGDALAMLFATERQDGSGTTSDATVFGGPAGRLTVSNDLFVDGGFGGTTRIASLQQAFHVAQSANPVPEPGSALVFGAGLLLTAMRLRSRRATP